MVENCRICKFFRKYPYKISEKEFLEKAIREGKSLRKLELLLESYGIKAKKDLISKHIKECMSSEVLGQRLDEKQRKRKGVVGKLKHIFKPYTKPQVECTHPKNARVAWMDQNTGNIAVQCSRCKTILGTYNPSKSNSLIRKSYRRYRDETILEALTT